MRLSLRVSAPPFYNYRLTFVFSGAMTVGNLRGYGRCFGQNPAEGLCNPPPASVDMVGMCAADQHSSVLENFNGNRRGQRGTDEDAKTRLAATLRTVSRTFASLNISPTTSLCPQAGVLTAALTVEEPYGIISTGVGNYVNNMRCAWILAPPASVSGGDGGGPLNLRFESFDTEEGADLVMVYDCGTAACESPSLLVGPISGQNVPPPITSQSGAMLVLFTSDSQVISTGFTAVYYRPCPIFPLPPQTSLKPPLGTGAGVALIPDGDAFGWFFAAPCPILTSVVQALSVEVLRPFIILFCPFSTLATNP